MPPVSGQKKLAEAVYTSIQDGTYSADQDVASAELQSAALQSLSVILENARADVKNSVSELSRLSASDIDGWITQAKQLREDIAKSEKQSGKIVAFAEGGREIRDNARDALSKVNLLQDEVTFNESLVGVLKEVQRVKQTLDAMKHALREGQLLESSKLLRSAEEQTQKLGKRSGTRIAEVMEKRISTLKMSIIQTATANWDELIKVDASSNRVSIYARIDSSSHSVDLEELSQALIELNLLEKQSSALCRSMDDGLIKPLLEKVTGNSFRVASNDQNAIELVHDSHANSTRTILEGIQSIQSFCQQNLPKYIWTHFSAKLDMTIVDRLMETTLKTAVPLDVTGLPAFQQVVDQLRSFALSFSEQSRRRIIDWADDASNTWLSKHVEESLNSVRRILKRGLGRPRQVERVETQIVNRNDEVFTGNGMSEDWNAGWSDEEKDHIEQESSQQELQSPRKNGVTPKQDEDVTGWGFEDEDEQAISPINDEAGSSLNSTAEAKGGDAEQDEAWGWGDDNESSLEMRSPGPAQITHPRTDNINPKTHIQATSPQGREVTLRESYHISALPDQILEVVIMVIEDADALLRIGPSNSVFPAAKGLYLLPGLLLSLFKAISPTFYGNEASGNMYLYNDCLYLSERLKSYVNHHQAQEVGSSSLKNLSLNDIPDLESFGKRAYGKDMESKRTTVTDLLDGAQGFSNSTQEPFASQCDLAVSSVIDYLRLVNSQWSPVLSRSALLQSMGSLLSTVTNKVIIDIEDMGDISEPESQRLVSFCKSITTLEDLFLPQTRDDQIHDEQDVPLTAAYTRTWLRFQYLSNILESSLVDIKYLWTEGELSLEFTVDEVTDLIEALFTDSDHRRRAIAEIRRSR